jgi:hypothetical protein
LLSCSFMQLSSRSKSNESLISGAGHTIRGRGGTIQNQHT